MAKEQPTTERDTLYKEQFDLLSFNTTEYEYMLRFYETTLLPQLPAREHFLDVGCGRGNSTRPLSAKFARTTIVEVNPVYFAEVTEWARAEGRNVTGYNADWLDVSLENVQPDFALMSHILYYVDPEKRSPFIRKAYDLLKPGGILLIVLMSAGSGTRHLYKTFLSQTEYEYMPYGEAIAALLRDEGYPDVQEMVFPVEITVPTHRDMEMLIDFMLLQRVAFDTEERLAQRTHYIEEHLTRNGALVMDNEGTKVIVRKPVL